MTNHLIKSGRRIAILVTLAILTIYSGPAQAASSIPAFNLPDATNGKMMDSKSLKGKVILINFFTTL